MATRSQPHGTLHFQRRHISIIVTINSLTSKSSRILMVETCKLCWL